MIAELLIFLITFGVAYFVYLHYCLVRDLKKKGIKVVPGLPIFGNAFKSVFGKRHVSEDVDEVYRAFPDERYVAYLESTTPIIMIRDPELIKLITVKDFDHFVDHKKFFDEETEPLFGGSILMMSGERWRDMRTTLSPAFTGSKMRLMMPFMAEISQNIIEYLNENVSPNEDIHFDDVIRRYTNDVIASTAFGLQVNSLKEKDNDFFQLGQTLFKFTAWQKAIFFVILQFPVLATKFRIKIFPEKTTKFFQDLVKNTMSYREKNNVERPDMIQLLMEASKGNLKHSNEKDEGVGFATVDEGLKPRGNVRNWTINELTGQVFIFFVAGFESAATQIVMFIHEMALNPDLQERLYQELRTFKEINGQLTYDNINQLKYLDCVLNETMRRWAVAIFTDRVCTKAYELPPPHEGGKKVMLQPGDMVYNSLNSIHLDPKYYPDPKKFDPERFSEENRHKIKPFTFMPFGMGPRNCIGSKFALLELKVLLYNLFLNYEIKKGPKTLDPIILDPDSFNTKMKGGSYVRLVRRPKIDNSATNSKLSFENARENVSIAPISLTGKLKSTQEKDEGVKFATQDKVLKPRGNIRNWTLTELSGQVFIFFMAGFESSTTALVMVIHELELHPEAQEKLYQEVKRFKETHGQLTFENINQLNYLDCVLNETMRKWSPGIIMDRICTVPYELPPAHEGGKPYKLNKGDLIFNMINSVQLDPKHFPDPYKFDPERFSDENKHKIKPFTFMPFGMGPRNCIGSRFVLLELKVLMYDMALNFKMEKGPKTSNPIKLDPENFNIKAKGGTYVKLVKRD